MREVGIQWCKSSFSDQPDGACVELALHRDCILLRESDDPGPVIRVVPSGLRALLNGIKADAVKAATARLVDGAACLRR
ncbi:DUF397 domain-containing protein [Streptomyces sp. UNOC14_S4]|uniref:DUF397 domain-containing protein n=1 Tax=Streptomyces sp. UNOC14_S4 TaxID=2872340 RepID=UPI001E53F4D6|nr:DUF397 domain-containing protein [Streptomyces sp. UNOC14_S4]MCC3768796.1 DUF397 domain-containing protein [Streptomyces sp. UNOC14_S4]